MFGPRKSLDSVTSHPENARLAKSLCWPQLIALGVGAMVGSGIYTLVGVGAERAGPGVILAFVICSLVCGCAALACAELASMIPAAGSAYTFSYTALGEGIAWVVGWSLISNIRLPVRRSPLAGPAISSAGLSPQVYVCRLRYRLGRTVAASSISPRSRLRLR